MQELEKVATLGIEAMRITRLLPILLLLVVVAAPACKRPKSVQTSEKVWTELEIRTLQGKSRDEIREILGPPNGFYTTDSKGRWHYSDILLSSEGAGKPRHVWVLIYFSRQGEQRATIVDILDRNQEAR
jgi:outer membrane protein assembly factor BamE (lipoprotein component of BamABCDE complex)